MKKRTRLTACLAAGVMILAVSATAAFGSVNGYSQYKQAVKALALNADNFTAKGSLSLAVDGKSVTDLKMDLAMDGKNYATHEVSSGLNNETYESFSTTYNGATVYYSTGDGRSDNTFSAYQDDNENGNTLAARMFGINADDEMANRLVTFAELAADTVVGELKNNFVQVGKDNGSTLYQVEIAGSQVPSLVNAGLSLFAYSAGQANQDAYSVSFESWDATAMANYEKATGKTLSADFKEAYLAGYGESWYEENAELINAINGQEDWVQQYYDVLEEKGSGIVYVHADGSYDYYADYSAFGKANPELVQENMETYMGQDMTLDKVLCTFGVDDNGNLTSNLIQATFQTEDLDGNRHEMVISGEVALSDYGATTISPLDVGDRQPASQEAAQLYQQTMQ